MAKFLRHLAVDPEPAVRAVLGGDTAHLCWMFEHYLAPYPSGGVSKVHVWLTADPAPGEPTECLGIAEVREPFDAAGYAALPAGDRPRYYLDRLLAALARCAAKFGWDPAGLAAARDHMLADGLRFAFLVGRPVGSPDRRAKAQGWVEAGPRTRLWVVFTDRAEAETGRALLSEMPTGSFDVRYVFGRVEWADDRTVRVTQDNGRDYWLCSADGRAEFHYPRAERGDPAGEFALGRMYYEGTLVLQDRERGLGLVRSAAAKGDKHARAFLARVAGPGG